MREDKDMLVNFGVSAVNGSLLLVEIACIKPSGEFLLSLQTLCLPLFSSGVSLVWSANPLLLGHPV